jgi:hypothetical protein
MPANNSEQVTLQIKDMEAVANKAVVFMEILDNLIKQDGAVGQNWNTLQADYGALVDADGTVLVDGARRPYTTTQLNQAEKAMKALFAIYSATTVDSEAVIDGGEAVTGKSYVEVVGDPQQRIRELLISGGLV